MSNSSHRRAGKTALILCLLATGCGDSAGGDTTADSSTGSNTGAGNNGDTESGTPLTKPCEYFTPEIAALMVDGPFSPGDATIASSVSMCRLSQSQGRSGAFARFEAGYSVDTFKTTTCKDMPEVPGLGLYACSVGDIAISMLTSDGAYNLQVGNAPLEKCKATLLALENKVKSTK